MAIYEYRVTMSDATNARARAEKMWASASNGSCLAKSVTAQAGLHPLLCIDEGDLDSPFRESCSILGIRPNLYEWMLDGKVIPKTKKGG